MYNALLFFGTNCLALNRSGKSGTKISWSSIKQIPLKYGKRVTDSSQAKKYIFSPDFFEVATSLTCNASAKLPIFNQCRVRMPQTFSLLPVFLPVLVDGNNSVALINVVINFGYEYFWFEFIFPNLFPIFFCELLFSTFDFNIFFPKLFFKIFIPRALPSMPPGLQRQNGLFMCLCYEKYDMQQAVEIELSSRVMCKVLVFGSYCSHHTRRKKSNFFPLLHNILLYFFWNLRYLIEVLKCFLDGI